ncbi:MAG: hypothetical protein ACOYJY_06365, partial [Acutalibacteraceae bacterium]
GRRSGNRREGSSPSFSAKQKATRKGGFFAWLKKDSNPSAGNRRGQRLRAPPGADTASRGWRSGQKTQGQARSARGVFWAPQEGSPSFSANKETSFVYQGKRGFFYFENVL